MAESPERKFIHDIAGPLTGLQLNLENATLLLEDGKAESLQTVRSMLDSSLAHLKKMVSLIQERRTVLTEAAEK